MSLFYQTTQRDTRAKTITARAHRTMCSHLRTWTLGVLVTLEKLPDGETKIQVRKTGGSNGFGPDTLIAEMDTTGGLRLFETRPDPDHEACFLTVPVYERKGTLSSPLKRQSHG